jgi:hypothetical protein
MLMQAAENMASQWLIVNYKSYASFYTKNVFQRINSFHHLRSQRMCRIAEIENNTQPNTSSYFRYAMFEKYNASMLTEDCAAGGGGEYEVQVRALPGN